MKRGTPRVNRGGLPSMAGVSAPSDRRFRRRDMRPGRRPMVAVWRVLRLLALVTGGAVLIVWLGSTVLGSRLLAVDRFVVRGTVRLTASDVTALVDGMRGDNILGVDLALYRTRVLSSPWVADVTFWRVLPSTIEIRVTERQPVAVARFGSALYLVDPSGVIIDLFGSQYRDVDLPIIDGLVSQHDGGLAADPERMRLAVRVLTALQGAAGLRDRLSQLDVENLHNVRVLIDGDPAWLQLGDEAFAERLGEYLEIAEQLRERFPADDVDLRFLPKITITEAPDARSPRE